MNLRRLPPILLIAAGAALLGGDRLPEPGRIVAGLAAERALDPAVSGFHLFGWFSPPTDSMSEARAAEYAAAGFDLMFYAWADSGARETNRRLLDLAGPLGLRCMLWDRRMNAFATLDPLAPAGGAVLDSIVADWAADSAFFGYYLGDEPPLEAFEPLGRRHAALRARDPAHPGWNNLLGRGAFERRDDWFAHTRAYVERVRPAILSNDHYDLTAAGDRGQYVENAAGLSAVARAAGVPWWGTIQLVQHAEYRPLTAGELRWQAAMLLAYGARGMGIFTYWTPAPDPRWNWRPAMIAHDGTRTAYHERVAAIHRELRPAGEALAACTWLATEHAGSVPEGATRFTPDDLLEAVGGRAVLAHFADTLGRQVMFVANPDSAHARTITLRFGAPRGPSRLYVPTGGWARPVARDTLALALDPGGFAVLRFENDAGWIATGAPPVVAVRDTAGGFAFHVRGAQAPCAIEVLDARGARVWSAPIEGGGATLVWPAALAAAGAYQVRVEDAGGVRTRRIDWKGGRR